MGKFDVKNESGANKKGRGFGSGNTVRREAFVGISEALNALQVKFGCVEGNEGGRFSECLRVTTAYLRTRLEGGGDAEMSIRNGKLFDLAWPDPVRPTPDSMKAIIQAYYYTRAKRGERLWINLSTAYGLVLDQCTNYLWSRFNEHIKLLEAYNGGVHVWKQLGGYGA